MNTQATISVRIDRTLYEQTKIDAIAEHRTIPHQIAWWAKIGRAALDNPDLPVHFIVETLSALAEPCKPAPPFIARSLRPDV